MHANKREEITEVRAGDICACVGLKNVTTGDTICNEDKPVLLETIEFPEPVIHVAVEPKTKTDQEKMGVALHKLAQEDPTFRVHTDEDSSQTIISGMGELHLEIIVDRMMREFNVQANVGKPQVAYRETLRKNSRGRGQVHPPDRRQRPVRPRQDPPESERAGKGFEFEDDTKGGSVPKEYIKPIEMGIKEAMEGGVSGRLSDGGREGLALRRQLSRSGLQRTGVQDRRFDGLQGGRPQGKPRAAGAGDVG